MKELQRQASINHADSALDILNQLRADNNNGGIHRDFMQQRLDATKARQEMLQAELDACEKEIKDVHTSSWAVGEERRITRAKLTRTALRLLGTETESVTDRELLWIIISEHEGAHYQDAPSKMQYAHKLLAIDNNLREKNAFPTHHVLQIKRDDRYDESFEYTFGETNPATSGLALDKESRPIIPLAYSSSEEELVLSASYYSGEQSRVFNSSNLPEDLNIHANPESDKYREDDYNQRVDLMIGSQAINAYLKIYLEEDSEQAQAELEKVGFAINRVSPDFIKTLETATSLQSYLSKRSIDTTLKSLLNNRSIKELATLRDLMYNIQTPEDKQRLVDALDTADMHFLETLFEQLPKNTI